MGKISPFLTFTGRAEEAMKFYVANIPNVEISKIVRYGNTHPYARPDEKDKVMFGSLNFMGNDIMFMDMDAAHPAPDFSWASSIYINCKDETEFYAVFNGLKDGGSIMMGPEAVAGFRLCAWVVDKFGVTWQTVWK